MNNPVASLLERMRDVRVYAVIAIAIVVLAALDASLAWFTPSLLLTAAHRPANPLAPHTRRACRTRRGQGEALRHRPGAGLER